MRIFLSLKFKATLFCWFILFSCTKKSEKEASVQADLIIPQTQSQQINPDPELESLKKIAPYFRFAASLEREILKTIRPDFNLPMTQFEILSTLLDQRVGIKRNFGSVDCRLYNIENKKSAYSIFKQCQSPQVLISEIEIKNSQQLSIRFYTKNWASVLGQSVALTGADRECTFQILRDKLIKMSCDNTALALDQSTEVQELRLKEFVFDQKSAFQVQVAGGFFKNLVEHRKLNLKIPFEGKIKVIEKELKVRDDFAELDKPIKTEHEMIQNPQPEVSDGKKNIEEKNDQENKYNQDHNQESNQENVIKESGQDTYQEGTKQEEPKLERGR